jgi:hypothetical protein
MTLRLNKDCGYAEFCHANNLYLWGREASLIRSWIPQIVDESELIQHAEDSSIRHFRWGLRRRAAIKNQSSYDGSG